MADTLAGYASNTVGLWANAVAPTLSDTTDDPAGTSQGIICTGVAGNIVVILAGGATITLAIAVGWSGLIPLRIARVKTTGTTATGLLLLYK